MTLQRRVQPVHVPVRQGRPPVRRGGEEGRKRSRLADLREDPQGAVPEASTSRRRERPQRGPALRPSSFALFVVFARATRYVQFTLHAPFFASA